MTPAAAPLWTPSPAFIEQSNLFAFFQWLKTEKGLHFETYDALWEWSVTEVAGFWEAVWTYFDLQADGIYSEVLSRPAKGMIGTRWFEGTRLSYAEHIFRQQTEQRPAVVFQQEGGSLTKISWAELASQVARLAAHLRQSGVAPGDRVVSFLPNIPQALIAFLAANACGAVWSSCSPDFGVASVVERFQQIEPKVLFVADGSRYHGKPYDRRPQARELVAALPSLEQVIFLPYLDPAATPGDLPKAHNWQEALSRPETPLSFERVPFSHPIWVLYSSGTTGQPKAITHSVGGILLEHHKALIFHQNCRPGDRFFWYSTTGWMMWNYANSALLGGSTLAIYDGAASYPDLGALWQFAQDAQITHFGGGAAYFIACMQAELSVAKQFDLSALQSVGSTGSPLPPEAFRWLYEAVKTDLWLVSLSGGTDVCSGFVGGSPYLPVYAGEIQCRLLGCKVEALDEAGQPLIDEVGEMVISEPMPSMPIFFWQDEGNRRYRSSYFETYPGRWRHGDWVKVTDRGSLVIYGRSDATLNRGGVRIGTSEVYRGLTGIQAIEDSLVVSLERPDGSYFMPLFVVLAEGAQLDEALLQAIKQQLRSQFSPRHVPDEVIEVPAIPYTLSGKKMETPVKKILLGHDPGKAISQDAMKDPQALAPFLALADAWRG
jgi:acetoacetyl-CoA synthetase